MSFAYTTEQEELRALLRTFFNEQITSGYLRKRISKGEFLDSALWESFSGLGMFPYFCEPSAVSGRVSLQDLSIVAFEAGRVLCPENIIDALLCGPLYFANLLDDSQRALLSGDGLTLDLVNSGKARMALGLVSEETWKQLSTSYSAERSLISHRVVDLIGVESSTNVLLVPISTDRRETIFLSGALRDGSAWEFTPALDLTLRLGRAAQANMSAVLINNTDSAWILHAWCTLRAMELAGMAQTCVAKTIEHVSARKQFGVAVGTFQAVQHQLADAHLKVEALTALSSFAAWTAAASSNQFPLAARAALSFGRDEVPRVIETAIQLHGGIGFTWEFDLHLYLRRARMIAALSSFLADEDSHSLLLSLAENG